MPPSWPSPCTPANLQDPWAPSVSGRNRVGNVVEGPLSFRAFPSPPSCHSDDFLVTNLFLRVLVISVAKSYQDYFLICKTEVTVLVREVFTMKEVRYLVFGQVPY